MERSREWTRLKRFPPMKVIGVTLEQLQTLARECGCRIARRNNYGQAPKTGVTRAGLPWATFTLRAEYANGKTRPYRRVSTFERNGKRRTIGGVLCWHGHRDFMLKMFERFPGAILTSCLAKYDGQTGFLRDFPETGFQNIGGEYRPMELHDACYCYMDGHDERGLPLVA